jgi:hypothetical protein
MARYDLILDKYQLSAVDRRIAADLARRYGRDPRFADRFEAYVSEYAKCMGRVEAGEIAPADVAAQMTGLAEMIGTPPDLLTNLQSHFDRDLPAEFAAAPEQPAETEEPAAPAQAQTPQPAQQPPAAEPTAQPQPAPAQAAVAPVAAPVQPTGPTRAELQQEIAKWESAMREPEGSPGWKSYWREGGSRVYLSALQASESVPEDSPAPATFAASGTPSLSAPAQPSHAAEPSA